MEYRPDTGRVLMELAEALLRGPSTLSRGERELIAAYVSSRNDCSFCTMSHAAFAAAQLEGGADVVDAVRRDPSTAPIAPKVRALLEIAGEVQQGGKAVREESVRAARSAGATDREIHDAVLIAAAFCMFNRYVDGLATLAPANAAAYAENARIILEKGYVR
jgi:uncharacterized peroxidase-related enzyme